MAMNIVDEKKVAANGLLSKIEIGGKVYEIKDLIARESIGTLAGDIDKVAGDLAALSYIKATGVYADDAAIKSYIDSQVGAINKFDIHVLADGEELPTASAETMFVLYLKPETDAASGAYVEYITVKNGEEYKWEAIGSTKMDVTGFVTSEALADTLKAYAKTSEVEADIKEVTDSLGDLAHKDNATGTVAGQTISGVKATGTSTGSISVELQATEKDVASAGKYTPAGNVSGTVTTAGSIAVTTKYADAEAVVTKGDYTPAGNVTADFTHASTAATLTKGDYTPEGSVSVALSGASFNAITGVGTQASFTEGQFTPATLTHNEVTANYVEEAIVGSVADECLTFTAAGTKALSASKVTAFDGGSKAADSFTANTLPTMAAQTVGVQSATFTGTKAEDALVTGVAYDKAALNGLTFTGTLVEDAIVTGVSYKKADIDTATFTGSTVDIAATFAGTEGDISVSGKCHDYSVKTAQFNGADIELNVGDIKVAATDVTVQ